MSITTPDETRPVREFRAPRTMTPEELGDSLARLVWENFSDFVARGDAEISLADLGVPTEDGVPEPHASEEALIFIMWCHTRGAQLAFLPRASDELVRAGLDAMHRALFDDMVENGCSPSYLPIFEQRVSARYAEYNGAASISDGHLGETVARHLMSAEPIESASVAVTERAIAVANPLRDFLEEVELVQE